MIYSKETADIICKLIVEGYDLRQISKVRRLPSKATIFRWLKDYRKIYFLDEYRRAKELQHYIQYDNLMDLCSEFHYTTLGKVAGRIHKLHPRANLKPACALSREMERRARLAYDADGRKIGG